MDKLEFKRKPPKSALALYVTLYCKRKKTTKSQYQSILIEATKSWISLSKKEKSQFLDKHKECQREFAETIANSLAKVKPYLKKRKSKLPISSNEIAAAETDSIVKENDMPIEEEPNVLETVENQPQYDDYTSLNPEQSIQDYEICEPTPPTLISGEQLFKMVHNRPENDHVWAELPESQKRHYRRAILSIKKEYLKNYQMYLESLTSPKLISHYKTTVGY